MLKFSDASPEAQQGSAQPSYRLAGDRSVRPRTIRDNGTDTRIVWDGTVELPAVFGIDENGEEMLLNGRMTSTGYLVEGVHEETNLLLQGRHAGQAPDIDGKVIINDGVAKAGDLVMVEITDVLDYDLVGRIVTV